MSRGVAWCFWHTRLQIKICLNTNNQISISNQINTVPHQFPTAQDPAVLQHNNNQTCIGKPPSILKHLFPIYSSKKPATTAGVTTNPKITPPIPATLSSHPTESSSYEASYRPLPQTTNIPVPDSSVTRN